MTSTKRQAGRIGVLGGTFDPVHRGHLAMAEAARTACRLDRVLFMPAHQPPHKRCHVAQEHRLAMLHLAVDGIEGCEVSDFELRRPGPSYTVDTLAALARELGPDTGIFFLIGADAFAEIQTWKEPQRLLDHASLVVIARPSYPLPAEPALPLHRLVRRDDATWQDPRSGNVVRLLVMEPVSCSSTEIRRRLAVGRDISDMVPPPVYRYILAHHLYRRT